MSRNRDEIDAIHRSTAFAQLRNSLCDPFTVEAIERCGRVVVVIRRADGQVIQDGDTIAAAQAWVNGLNYACRQNDLEADETRGW